MAACGAAGGQGAALSLRPPRRHGGASRRGAARAGARSWLALACLYRLSPHRSTASRRPRGWAIRSLRWERHGLGATGLALEWRAVLSVYSYRLGAHMVVPHMVVPHQTGAPHGRCRTHLSSTCHPAQTENVGSAVPACSIRLQWMIILRAVDGAGLAARPWPVLEHAVPQQVKGVMACSTWRARQARRGSHSVSLAVERAARQPISSHLIRSHPCRASRVSHTAS